MALGLYCASSRSICSPAAVEHDFTENIGMGILRTALKTLLIVTLAIAPVIAYEKPATVTPTKASKQQQSKSISSKARRAKSNRRPRVTSGQLFFSPGSSKAQTETPEKPGATRQAMKITTAPEPVVAPEAVSLQALEQETAKPLRAVKAAIAEIIDEEQTAVHQVLAVGDNPFLDFADVEAAATPELPFDEADASEATLPEFLSEPEINEQKTEEPPTPAIDFDAKVPAFDAEPLPAEEPIESDEASEVFLTETVTAVPTTDGSSLPYEHTGTQQPSVEVKWTSQETLNIGQKCECSLVVTNTGGSLVRNVTAEAAIPEGVDVLSAVPAPQQGTSCWSVGDLNAGETRSIKLVMIPHARGDLALNAFVRFTGYATSVLTVQEPLVRMIVEGPESVTIGEQAEYIVRVENPGTGTAQNVVVEAIIPEGMHHHSGSVPRIQVGALSPGESRQVRLNLTALEGGEYQLAFRAIADGGISDDTEATISIARPSLKVAIDGPATSATGKPANYEVIVTNTGNIPSINVRAKYKLPNEAQFIRADRGGVHRKDEGIVDWFVGTVQPGQSVSYHVIVKAETPGTGLHRAGVKSEHTGVTTVSHSTTVQGVPKLLLEVATAEPAPAVGQETVVRIIVQNDGIVDAEKVSLSCELPSGLEFVAAEGPSQFLAESGMVIFRSVDAIEAGSEATYLIKARCVRAGNHRARVRLGSPSLTEPVIGEATVTARSAE
jgi:uncharacterized repeat protein (TIGR01451 family)